MNRFTLYIVILVFSTFTVISDVVSADWHQYLGPDRNSTSPETGIMREWPEGGPEVLWTVDVGTGYGGPAIKDGKVYLLDRDNEVGDNLRCFDLTNGEELWSFAYDAPGSVMFAGSRSVPAVDDNYVYTCGHNGDLYCIDINTHKPVWHKNIWTDFGGIPASTGGSRRGQREVGSFPVWAITQNPLLYEGLLIVSPQAPEAGVVAYDILTGDIKWKTPYLGNESYASPSIVKIDGKDQIIAVVSSTNPISNRNAPQTLGTIAGIDPITGEILWAYKEWECHISVPSAIDAGNNKVLVVGGYEHGVVMLEINKQSDDSYTATELFKHTDFGDQTKPPILHNDHFYAQYETNAKRDGLTCMNMDGEIMWKTEHSPMFNRGSMILVDGIILATNGMNSLYVIEPDPSEFKPLASAELLAKAETGIDANSIESRFGGATQNWAPIALSNGKLLIRNQSQMKCVIVGK